jgi:hypothetical protein
MPREIWLGNQRHSIRCGSAPDMSTTSILDALSEGARITEREHQGGRAVR